MSRIVCGSHLLAFSIRLHGNWEVRYVSNLSSLLWGYTITLHERISFRTGMSCCIFANTAFALPSFLVLMVLVLCGACALPSFVVLVLCGPCALPSFVVLVVLFLCGACALPSLWSGVWLNCTQPTRRIIQRPPFLYLYLLSHTHTHTHTHTHSRHSSLLSPSF